MEVESKIIVVRGSNDILNSAYLSPINDGKCEFPSVEHYCQFQILFQAGFAPEAQEILDAPNVRNCCKSVRHFIIDRFCQGDADRASQFMSDVKDEHLRIGLLLRFKQDFSFRRALMDTGRALLAHCDLEDFQYGLGMDEKSFYKWVDSNGLKTDVLFNWFRRYDACPCQDVVGNNKLGLALMDIRAEEMDRLRRSPQPLNSSRMQQPPPPSLASLTPFSSGRPDRSPGPLPIAQPMSVPFRPPPEILPLKQLSPAEIEEFMFQRYVTSEGDADGDGEWIVSDQILALDGPFALLSQYYATPIVTKKRRYRSVEHYAYQKFFRNLKMGRKAVEKLVTTPDPSKLSGLARRLLMEFWKKDTETTEKKKEDEVKPGEPTEIEGDMKNFYNRLLVHYERATKLKFEQYPVLKRLLVATGDALLIETCPTTDRRAACEWTICVRESDIQRFLTSSRHNTGDLLRFILKPDKKFFRFFSAFVGRNRAGLALMRLRREYRSANVEILHLPPPPPTGGELDETRLICFTDTSVFHPTYISPFWTKDGNVYQSVQHFIALEAAKKFGFPDAATKQLADCEASDVYGLLTWNVYQRFPDPERHLQWFWTGGRDEALKFGSRLKFEKHPDLLRALLETGNSMLVYCRDRFQSDDTEWSIGSTEHDLKQWMQESRCDCRTLLKWCLSPLETRPGFLGGNRLGALLMELRREYRLRGFQAHTLPKVSVPVEVVLGLGADSQEDEELENCGLADVVWPSPHFLLSKKRGQPVLDRPNKKRKLNEFSSSSQTPAEVVALMGVEQLKQSAAVLLSKLLAMRKETEWENENLNQMLTDLAEIRDRIPTVELPAPSEDAAVSKPESDLPSTDTARQPAPAPSAAEQKEKWFAFESGLTSVLRKATGKATKERADPAENDKSIFDSKNWNENQVRPLVDRVWPHLTIRERRTASEWLWYTILKLENMRRSRKSPTRKTRDQLTTSGSLLPKEKTETKWIMPQMKVVMTQKSSEANDGARAGTPQGEGTTIDAIKYKVDWILPETGVYPRFLSPLSP